MHNQRLLTAPVDIFASDSLARRFGFVAATTSLFPFASASSIIRTGDFWIIYQHTHSISTVWADFTGVVADQLDARCVAKRKSKPARKMLGGAH